MNEVTRDYDNIIDANSGGFLIYEPMPLRILTARYLHWCVDMCGGNHAEAARMTGVSCNTIRKYVGDSRTKA